MSFTRTTTPVALAGNLVTISQCTNSAEDNVTADSSGRIYQVKADNSLNEQLPAYLKIVDASSATVGTTNPDILIEIPAGESVNYIWEAGFPYAAGVSVWCTDAPQSSSNSPLGSPVSVIILAST